MGKMHFVCRLLWQTHCPQEGLASESRHMKTVGKLLLYGLFLGLTAVFFGRFRDEYARSDASSRRLERAEGVRESEPINEVPAEASTNLVDGAASTVTSTNLATNSVASPDKGTNSSPATNALKRADGGKVGSSPSAPTQAQAKPPSAVKPNRSALYLGGFVGGLLALALLLGWDVTQWAARKATTGLGADLAPVEGDPEYDAAEAEWAKGNHLDAIKLLRDFLKHNPSQQHAAIRIAEIYEKDLQNFLAAALELEEVLTKRLPREKWGWTAIRLANIYSGRMNQPEKALATLDRIVREYPDTSAAKKARQRLGLPEQEESDSGEMAAENLPAVEPVDDNPAMPKGFKPRKR